MIVCACSYQDIFWINAIVVSASFLLDISPDILTHRRVSSLYVWSLVAVHRSNIDLINWLCVSSADRQETRVCLVICFIAFALRLNRFRTRLSWHNDLILGLASVANRQTYAPKARVCCHAFCYLALTVFFLYFSVDKERAYHFWHMLHSCNSGRTQQKLLLAI